MPGVLYGGGGEPVGFDADARELRLALAGSGAVLDLSVDGSKATPVVLKEAQRDPVRGETIHVDLLRVRLDEAIHAVVPLELTGAEDAPGVKEGGVLEQITRELNVEALPTAIPESIVHEVGEMQIGETIVLSAVAMPGGRDAARRPRGDGRRDPLSAAPAGRGGGGNRGRDGARRRGRGAGRGAEDAEAAGGAEALLRRGVAAPAAPLRRRWRRGRRLADRRAGQPRPRVRRDTPQRRASWSPRRSPSAGSWAGAKERFRGRIAEGRAGGVPGGRPAAHPRVAVLCPQTYMNDAGRSVGPARGAFKLPLERVLVVHDEIDLPFGEVRTRLGGGLAGHNGLKSLKRELGGARLHARARRASGGRTRPTRRSSRHTCSGASARPRRRSPS